MLATRLWQNTAKVHFDATNRDDGRRLIYGGHVISLARTLSFNGLANAQIDDILALLCQPCGTGKNFERTLRAETRHGCSQLHDRIPPHFNDAGHYPCRRVPALSASV